MSDKRKSLYDRLTSDGYTLGEYSQFERAMNDSSNRRRLYDRLNSDGYKLGDYDKFDSGMRGEVTHEQQEKSQEQPKRGSTYNHYEIVDRRTKPYKERYEANTEKIDSVVTSPSGFEYAAGESGAALYAEGQRRRAEEAERKAKEEEAAEEARKMREYLEESGELDRLEGMKQQAEAITDKVDKQGAPIGVGASFAINNLVNRLVKRFTDKEYAAAAATRDKIEETQDVLDEASHADSGWLDKEAGGLLRGAWDAGTRVNTWDFGATDIADATTLNAIINKNENGEQLSASEQNLLDVMGLTAAIDMAYQDQLGTGYHVGQSLPQSAGFMVQMSVNPLSGLGKAAAKKFGTTTAKKIAARALGDVAGMAGVTATTGAGRVAADYYDRLNGQSTFDIDENGIIRYGGQQEQEEADAAIWKAIGSNFIENYTEAIGDYFSPISNVISGIARNGVKKAGFSGLIDALDDIKSSQWSRAIQSFNEKAKFDDFLGELMEEEIGMVLNAATVGDMSFDPEDKERYIFNPETQKQTILSVGFMQGTMLGIKAAGSKGGKMYVTSRLNAAERNAANLWGDRWEDLKEQLDGSTIEQRERIMEATMNATDLSEEQKKAVMDYATRLTSYQAYNSRVLKNKEEMTEEAKEAEAAYEAGNGMTDNVSIRESYKEAQKAASALSDEGLATSIAEAANNGSGIDGLLGGLDAEKQQQAREYYNQQMRLKGIRDRVESETAKAIEHEYAEIERLSDANGMYLDLTITQRDERGEEVQVSGNVVGYIGGAPVWLPDGAENTEANRRVLKPNEYNAEDLNNAMPKEELKERMADYIRKNNEKVLEDYLNYDPDVYDVEYGSQFQVGETTYVPLNQNEFGETIYQAIDAEGNAVGVPTVVTADEMYSMMQEAKDAAEQQAERSAERAKSEPIIQIPSGQRIIATQMNKDDVHVVEVDESGNQIEGGIDEAIPYKQYDAWKSAWEKQQVKASEENTDNKSGNVQQNEVIATEEVVKGDNEVAKVDAEEVQQGEVLADDSAGEAVAPTSVTATIPTDDKGNVLYESVPIDTTLQSIAEEGLEDNEVDEFVAAQQKEADVTLKKLQNNPPKVGTNIAKYKEAKKAWEDKVTKAQVKVDYWNGIAEAIKKSREQVGDAVAEEILQLDEVMTAEELAAQQLASGRLPLLQQSYMEETGYGRGEVSQMIGLFRSKENGGMTIDHAAELLALADEEEHNGRFFGGDSAVARDVLLGVLSEVQTRGGLNNYIQGIREQQAKREQSAEQEAYERGIQEMYGVSVEEYELALNDYINKNPFEGVDVEEIDAIFAEAALEYEQQLNSIENGEGTINESVEGSDNVLPDEQLDNEGRDSEGTIGGQTEGIGGSVSSEDAATQGEEQQVEEPTNEEEVTEEVTNESEQEKPKTEIEFGETRVYLTDGEKNYIDRMPIRGSKEYIKSIENTIRSYQYIKVNSQDIKTRLEKYKLAIAYAKKSLAKKEALKAKNKWGVKSGNHAVPISTLRAMFAEWNSDDAIGALFERVMNVFEQLGVRVTFDDTIGSSGTQGWFSLSEKRIKLPMHMVYSDALDAQKRASVMLHEMIHAVTTYVMGASDLKVETLNKFGITLSDEMREAAKQLNNIYNIIKKDRRFKGQYGLKNPKEMVAELSEPDFRQLLKETNIWQDIVNAIKKLLGIDVNSNALDGASKALDYILDNADLSMFNQMSQTIGRYLKEDEIATNDAQVDETDLLAMAERIANEEQRRKPLRERIKEWEKNGIKVNVLERVEDVPDRAVRTEIRNGSIVPGWYDTTTGEVYILLPHVKDLHDLDITILHEAVSHKGLRMLLGEERFNELCDKVWDMMPKSVKDYFENEYPGVKDIEDPIKRRRAAADEYMAFLAQEANLTPEEKTIWDKIVELFREIFDGAVNGLLNKSTLTNKDLAELIQLSYANLRSGANVQGNVGEGTRFSVKKKNSIEKNFGGLWIEDKQEFAKFASAVNQYVFEKDGQGIAYTDNHFYAYYWNINGEPIPYIDIYLNSDDSQDIINEVNIYYENNKGAKGIGSYIDRAIDRARNIESKLNDSISSNKKKQSSSRNDKLGSNIQRKGKYADHPELYVTSIRNSDSVEDGDILTYFRVTPKMDAEYLEAVNSGDMDKAQKMVNEAAKMAMPNTEIVDKEGYPMMVYHGTNASFNIFDDSFSSSNTGAKNASLGFFFTPHRTYAESIGGKDGSKTIMPVFLNITNPFEAGFAKKTNGKFHDGIERNPFDYRKAGSFKDGLSAIKDAVINKYGQYTKENAKKWKSEVEKYFDGLKIMTGDSSDFNSTLIPTMQYVAFNPSQIKSAEPVTYDDNGNVIPLSERFNPDSNDIRFRRTYHGSGAEFDHFDHSFMGTGEGNQAFGWGTYVTDVEGIAKGYANIYANNSPLAAYSLKWLNENGNYEDFITKGEGKRRKDVIEGSYKFLEEMRNDGASEEVIKNYEKDIEDAKQQIAEEGYNRTKQNMIDSLNRNLYTVDIPDNDGTNYLSWNEEPSKEQKDKIIDAFKQTDIYKEFVANYGEPLSNMYIKQIDNAERGEQVYMALVSHNAHENAPKETSQFLNSIGYVGIEVPTNYMSGGNTEGTKNYVIFNEHDLDIVEHTRFRAVVDPLKIAELETGEKVKVYRAMQLIDGKLYPPMSAKVDGKMREPIELGRWEEAEERPEMADDNGYFRLNKGNGKSLKARYNPYIHTSTTPLNDQFSSAQDRPELVTVEVEIPASELTSGYKAEKAKDAVGKLEWKAGVVQGKLSGTRTVILSRWDKPIRIVPDSEVADEIVKMFGDKQITMPSNVVTPSLRAELEKRGVPFVETDNQGKEVGGTRFKVKDRNELVAVHNISEGNLRKVLNVGGLIMPSIAITKYDMGHEGYGDISLLFDKETINPSDRRNKVYGGDAWTPRFPQIVPKISDKVRSNIKKKVYELIEDRNLRENYSLSAELHPDNIERNITNRGIEGYYNEEWMKLAYLLDNGKKVKIPMKMKDYGDMSETIIAMAKDRGLKVSDIQQSSFDFYNNNKDFVEAIKNIVDERKLSSLPEDKRDIARKLFGEKEMRFAYFDTLIYAARGMEYDLEHGGLREILDRAALRETIEKKVKTNNADYNKWVDNLFDGIVEKYGIRNNRDWYTPSGDLRRWEQLYDAATPSNILKHMLAENEQGGSGGLWDSNIMGASAESYDSIEEIREKGKKRLKRLTEEEYDAWSNSIANRMSDICYEFLSPSQREEFGASVDAKIEITNAVAKDKSANGIYKYMKALYPKFTMEHANRVEAIVKEIQDFAIGYFEAKPQRIVPLREVRKAIVPSGTSSDILDGLKDNGIDVVTYKKGNENARARLIKKESEGIRFRFIGERGAANLDKVEEATTRLDNLSVAREMESANKDAKAIKMATGWERGADGKWRYEVDDDLKFDLSANVDYRNRHPEFARFEELMHKYSAELFEIGEPLTDSERKEFEALEKEYGGNTELHRSRKLKDYLDAPELFKAYPELRNVELSFKELDDNTNGEYLPRRKEIQLNKKYYYSGEYVINPILVHEIQHAIQDIEGFAQGGNSEMDNPKKVQQKAENSEFMQKQLGKHIAERNKLLKKKDELNDKMSAWYDAHEDATAEDMTNNKDMQQWNREYDEIEAELENADRKVAFDERWLDAVKKANTKLGIEGYRKLAGEVESRNVENRMMMKADARRASLASETEDVAREDQIFLKDALVSDARFRVSDAPFYSNAERAVEGIKQEKATPQQWLAMIEKNGGLKAAEDKWLGLSDWLKASDKKSLTKAEVLEYINENKIQIEEVNYEEGGSIDELRNKYPMWDEAFEIDDDASIGFSVSLYNDRNASEIYNSANPTSKVQLQKSDRGYEYLNAEDEEKVIDWARTQIAGISPINSTRLKYTTKGLENKHEIALTVPTIESWNEDDEVHFGDAGDGRAVAWVRFGETTDADGNRVLVIDEVQSKRHQDGKKKGYKGQYSSKINELNKRYNAAFDEYEKYIKNTYNKDLREFSLDELEQLRVKDTELNSLYQTYREILLERFNLEDKEKSKSLIPAAPFEKNWSELAMKRMLRYAAENGYDKVAWTKGEQQVKRYDLSKVIDELHADEWRKDEHGFSDIPNDEVKEVNTTFSDGKELQYIVNREGVIVTDINDEHQGKSLEEVFGKDIAVKLMGEEEVSLRDAQLVIGDKGMKGFYDNMLPRFMNKYGKKWGVKVGEVELPNVEEAGRTMWSVDVTDAMKDSVMEGQPMFRVSNGGLTNEQVRALEFVTGKSREDVIREYGKPSDRISKEEADEAIEELSDAISVGKNIVVINSEEDIAKKLNFIERPFVRLARRNEKVRGVFNRITNRRIIFGDRMPSKKYMKWAILHESTHDAINSMLKDGSITKSNMSDVLAYCKDNFPNAYKKATDSHYSSLVESEESVCFLIGDLYKDNEDNLFEMTTFVDNSEIDNLISNILDIIKYGKGKYARSNRQRERRTEVGESRNGNARGGTEGVVGERGVQGVEQGRASRDSEGVRFSVRDLDSQGRKLSEGQQEFFANSKALDADGNLLVLYHGTTKAGFTEFKSGWFTTSKKDAISYSGDREGRMFDPNEKQSEKMLSAGDYRLGYMTFDTEEDRANFLKKHPTAEDAITEREYDSMLMQVETDEEENALQRRKFELEKIWDDYRRYEFSHLTKTTIKDILSNQDAYTENDFRRAILAVDSNAYFDEINDIEDAEERREALVDALNYMIDDIGDDISDIAVSTRIPRNGEGISRNDLSTRTYEVYINVENPLIVDGKGKHSEFESGDIYAQVEKGLKNPDYDGVIVRNWRVGRYQELGDVVVPKSGSQVKLISNTNPTNVADTRFRVNDAAYAKAVEEGDTKKLTKLVKDAAKAAMPNTKVVDRWGNPRVVYHGTISPDRFNEFKGDAIFFTSSMADAGMYSHQRAGGWVSPKQSGKPLSFFLNIENPLVIDARGKMWDKIQVDWSPTPVDTDAIAVYAKEQGYDGVIINKVKDSVFTDMPASNVYVAFSSSQVKDAGATHLYDKSGYGSWRIKDEVGATYDDNGNLIPLSERFDTKKGDIRFSVRNSGIFDDAGNELALVEREVGVAKDQYERTLRTGLYQFQEAMQDSMLSLKVLQKAIAKATKSKILDFENAWMAENALSSKSLAEMNAYREFLFKPLLQEIANLEKEGLTYEEISDYLITKHGIERNRELAVRESLKQDKDNYKQNLERWNREKQAVWADNTKTWEEQQAELDKLAKSYGANLNSDYSGLSAMYKNWRKDAYDAVQLFEANHNTKPLYDALGKATSATIDKPYESGMMTKETYEGVQQMFQFYVPLRGWEEETSSDVYEYLTTEVPAFNAPLKKMKGRKSKADDPIATLANVAESAILQGNRNLMKQKFLNMVLNHKSDAVSVSELWLQYDEVNDEWNAIYPQIPDKATADEVARIVEEFDAKMEQLSKAEPDKYMKASDDKNIPYKTLEKNLNEHQVIVKRGGKQYVLTINGNPRAAQALNGLTNPDNDASGAIGSILKSGEWLNRQLSAFYTTRNPNFMASNFLRDAIYSNTMTWVRESPSYAWRFNVNFAKVNPKKLHSLIRKYSKGKLDMSNPMEKAFSEFIRNGGETGYTNLRDVEGQKKVVKHELKKAKKMSLSKGVAMLSERFDDLNRSIENCARFAAYLTSRQQGRSIERSVFDAKEVSVNFNKKGAGAKFMGANGETKLGNVASFISGLGRAGFVFWNAGVQGLFNFGKAAANNPTKFTTAAATFYLLGALMPMLADAGDDDDDELDNYDNLPDYVRRTNICFRNGLGDWVTIPLPIELRALYGLGEMSTMVLSGKEKLDAKKVAEQLSQVMPIDMLEGEGGLKAFTPSAVKPLFEAYAWNKDWTGLPIYKDHTYNKQMPKWTKAYKNTDPTLVKLSRLSNEFTRGENELVGWADWNPAIVEHLLEGYFGGVATTIEQMSKSAQTVAGTMDFDWRNMPILSRVTKSGNPNVHAQRVNNEYYDNLDRMEELRLLRKEYDDNAKSSDLLERAKWINEKSRLEQDEEYKRYQTFKTMNTQLKKLEKQYKESGDENIGKQIIDMKSAMNEVVRENKK